MNCPSQWPGRAPQDLPSSLPEWENFRTILEQLYWAEDKELRDVMRIMRDEYRFEASQHQYKKQFKRWRLMKNVGTKEMKAILRIRSRRDAEGKKTVFKVRGRRVPNEKINRFARRQAMEAAEPDSLVEALSDIEYSTPGSTSSMEWERETPLILLDSELVPVPGTISPLATESAAFLGIPKMDVPMLSPEVGPHHGTSGFSTSSTASVNSRTPSPLSSSTSELHDFETFEDLLSHQTLDNMELQTFWQDLENLGDFSRDELVTESNPDQSSGGSATVSNFDDISFISDFSSTQEGEPARDFGGDCRVESLPVVPMAEKHDSLIRRQHFNRHLEEPQRFDEGPKSHINRDLRKAARRGDLPTLRTVLGRRPDVEGRSEKGHTPLLLASLYGNHEVVRALLEAGARPETSNPEQMQFPVKENGNMRFLCTKGSTSLHLAAARNHHSVIETLINYGAHVNAEDGLHETPLSLAVKLGNSEAVDILIRSGAAVSPDLLPLAAGMGYGDIVLNLALNGGDVNSRNSKGATALHLAAANGHDSIVDVLLDLEAQVDAIWDGKTPLYLAAEYNRPEAQALLLRHYPDARVVIGKLGMTLLHLAAYRGQDKLVALLLESGADMSAAENCMGRTPLHLACEQDHSSVVSLLCEHRSASNIINQPTQDGRTALYIACESGNLASVACLLEAGARIPTRGYTPIHLAHRLNHVDILNLLLDRRAVLKAKTPDSVPANPISFAYGNSCLQDIVHKKCGLATIKYGTVPLRFVDQPSAVIGATMACASRQLAASRDSSMSLFFAAQLGRSDVLSALLGAGVPVNKRDIYGRTALHFAAQYGRWQAVELLLRYGACVELRDWEGSTPLHYAASTINSGAAGDTATAIAILLREEASDINSRDAAGCTALHNAVLFGNLAEARMLLDGGADGYLENDAEMTALHYAVHKGDVEMVGLFKARGYDIRSIILEVNQEGRDMMDGNCGFLPSEWDILCLQGRQRTPHTARHMLQVH